MVPVVGLNGDNRVAWSLAMSAAADCHLLFGLLALQNGIVNQGQLGAAFQAWTLDKSKSLADHFEARGDLTSAKRALLAALAEVHLEAHGGDLEQSLAAISAGKSARESLALAGGPDVEATLGYICSVHTSTDDVDDDPDRTGSLSVGSATSDGQRFRILRPHARGGLGAVFVALDSELDREVALKQILDDRADDPTSQIRFLREAQITGGLEHPGIVPVYGLGAYGDGRPYYAMRFIRGDSLKEAIEGFHAGSKAGTDSRDLALRKLLRRFIDVCNAIDYAHSRGVIHRDIKPANIIVGKYGETLVVDWGLAKAMGQIALGTESGERILMPSLASGSAETLPGSAMGTPAYMSPEQAAGQLDRLGPRSDVYSLGATLYCVLTGQPPFRGDVIDVIRDVQRGEIRSPRQLDPNVDPALEAICLKAMANKPEDRYASSRALADDLDRWMADEAVSAWREPYSRRMRRWGLRNRTAVTAATVALVAGVIGLSGVLAVQTRAKADLAASNAELTRSRGAVQARYDLAVDAIKTFHSGVSEDFLLKQEQFKEVRDQLLKSASNYYGKLGTLLDNETDRASRRALWQANYELAELTGTVGKPEDALAAHRQVLVAREALAAERPGHTEIEVDVGRSLTAVADMLQSTGQTSDAEATFRKAEKVLVGLAAAIKESSAPRSFLADCRSRLGSLLDRTGRDDEGLTVYRLARLDQEALAAAPGATVELRRDLASTINKIATLLLATGKSSEAEAEFRKALTLYQKLADENPAVTDFRNRLALGHNNLGALLWRTSKPSEADTEYHMALALYQKLADDNPAVNTFRGSLARSHLNLGILLSNSGKPWQAEAEYNRALAIQQKLADDNPAITTFRSELGSTHDSLGILLSNIGKASDAEAEYRTALAIHRKLSDDNPAVTGFLYDVAQGHSNLGLLLSQTGKTSEAEAEYGNSLAIQQKLADDNPAVIDFRSTLAISHHNLGELLSNTGRISQAEAEFREAKALFEKLANDNQTVDNFQRFLAESLGAIGALRAQAGKTDEAVDIYTRETAIRHKLADARSATPDDRDRLANCQTNMADLLRRSGRLDDASAACERALAVREPLVEAHPEFPSYGANLGETYLRLGQVRCDMKDLAGAAAAYKRACTHYDASKSLNASQTFLRACGHAGLVGLAGRAGSGVSVAEGTDQAEKAMAILRQSITMGYRNPVGYRTESALDPLRNRPDFQVLVMDLAMPAEPFARGK
jgi:eukaryotic-like serine/threonine-protein kinase